MITEYANVDGSYEFVVKKVNERLKQGWQLRGQLKPDPNYSHRFYQVIVKESPPDVPSSSWKDVFANLNH